MNREEIETRFTYHEPYGDQLWKYQGIRDKAKEFAELILLYTPEGREQSLAITNLEQTVMWTNAAIARRS